jgi:hypothetical protein
MRSILKTLLYITLFSIAMGYLETAVVVYLRALYYPLGFGFPMKTIDRGNGVTEFWREVATIIMLYSAGWLAGKNKAERFAYFMYSFAIWDIFYYIFLKVLINWPDSLLTWDILFLIPVPWVGPVLAPCLVCVAMIGLAFSMIYFSHKGMKANLVRSEKLLIITGCLIIVISFIKDYLSNLSLHHDFNIWTPLSQSQLFADFMTFVPETYSWWLFSLGEICILSAIALYIVRLKSKSEDTN